VNSLERPILEFYALSGFAATDAERNTENFAELASLRHAALTDVALVGADPARLAAADAAAERLLPALVAFRRGEPDGLSLVTAAAADARPDGILGQLAGATIFQAAYDLDRGGDLARAAEVYEEALTLYPSLPEGWTNLGRARAATGQLADATAHLHRALELNPDRRAAHVVLAQLLAASGDRAGAAEHARAAARIAPESPDAHEGAGQALAAAGDADAALAEFRSALALRPTWATAMDQIALLLSLRPGAGERREALELARRASEVEPKNPTTLEVLAAVYATEGDVSHAIAAQRKAVDLAAQAGDEPLLAQERDELRRYERGEARAQPRDARRL
jgi:tetratricopeptide (TPR) repeat protein